MRSPYKVLSNRIHGAGVKGQREGPSFLVFPGLCNGTLSGSLPLPPTPRCLPWVMYWAPLVWETSSFAAHHAAFPCSWRHSGLATMVPILFSEEKTRVRNTSGFHGLFQQNQAFSLDCLTPGLGRLTAWILNAILFLHQKPPETVLDDMRKAPEHVLPEKSLHLYVSDQLIKLSWVLGENWEVA